MNAWDQARVKRDDSPRYVTDENRTRTEGARPLPWHCHDYPEQPKTEPKLKARLMAAMEQMECALGKSNGGQNDGMQ